MRLFSDLGKFLPFWQFWGQYMVFGDGSLGCGFKICGKDISCATNEEINSFTRKLENLITGLDEGLSLQVFHKITPKAIDLIEKHLSLSKNCPIKGYDKVLNSRSHYLREGYNRGWFFEPEIYIFLKGQPIALQKQSVLQKRKDFEQVQEDLFRSHLEIFKRSVGQLESSLKDCELFEHQLSSKEWFGLLYEHFNLSRSERHGTPRLRSSKGFPRVSLLSQFLLSDIHINKTEIEMGNYQFRTLSLKTLPDETYSGLINGLLNLPFHCWISQGIRICEQGKELRSLQLKRRLAHSMAYGSHISDLDSESKLGQIEGLLSELIGSSEKVVESDLNVIVWAESVYELDQRCDEVIRTFKKMNHSEGLVETFATFETFMKAAPGLCQMNRPQKMKTSNLAHLMPVFSFWRGNKKKTCLFTNRSNVLIGLDPFAQELPNWNGFVIGSSGSGKSFTINQLILMFIGDQT